MTGSVVSGMVPTTPSLVSVVVLMIDSGVVTSSSSDAATDSVVDSTDWAGDSAFASTFDASTLVVSAETVPSLGTVVGSPPMESPPLVSSSAVVAFVVGAGSAGVVASVAAGGGSVVAAPSVLAGSLAVSTTEVVVEVAVSTSSVAVPSATSGVVDVVVSTVVTAVVSTG